jgi:hypothetical protein
MLSNMKIQLLKTSLIFFLILFCGCEDELELRQDALTPYEVSIDGAWELYSVSRNGADLTQVMDLTDVEIEFSNDGTFSLSSSKIPFPTLKSSSNSFTAGSWKFNNDFQPTSIQFSNGNAKVPVMLDQPLYGSNNTNLVFEFSLGCNANTYQYQFKKK